ncbi:uncharacterized protein TNCV_4676271 [Trichonephila clavipes]|nr:uncharacterized protein TNCV_4676271 [Trichonephila clavipes]
MEWYEQQSECSPTQLLLLKRIRDLGAKNRRCAKHGLHSVSGYPNNRVSERCPVPIDSDKRSSTVLCNCWKTMAKLKFGYILLTIIII